VLESDIPECQKYLQLEALRDVFQRVDELSAQRLDDREILAQIVKQENEFSLSFVSWLVRHTLHPEAEDDIMNDELVSEEELLTANGYTMLKLRLARQLPALRLYHLAQFNMQFWHVIELNDNGREVLLRPLISYQ
jgi:hypothetical protein